MNNEPLYIILNQYKKEHITEEEAIKLIEAIYNNKQYIYNPVWWTTSPTTPDFPKYEITCSYERD